MRSSICFAICYLSIATSGLSIGAQSVGAQLDCEAVHLDDMDSATDEEPCGILNRVLFGERCPNCIDWTASGWMHQGFTWNPDSPIDRFNGHINQNDRANEYQLNQLYFAIGRAADTESDRMNFGLQTDVLYGTDAFYFQALGLDDRIVSDSASRFYKLAIPQAYAEIYSPLGNGITFQIGKWYALVGYETGLAPEDFFYSKALGYNITALSHTGILASFDLGEQWSTSHGIHRGNDSWEDNNNALAYTGLFSWTSLDEATILTFAYNVGPEQDERADWQDIDGAPGPDAPGESLCRFVYSLTLERQLTDQLSYVFNHDYFFQDGNSLFGIDDAEAYGFTQFLIYDHCECLSSGARLELYRDDDGFVASGFRSGNASAPGLYTNLSFGLNYRPTDCFMIRPEVRWDWQDRDDPTDTPAFDAGFSTRQFLFSVDAILSF